MVFDKHELAIKKYIVTNKTSSLDLFKIEALSDNLNSVSSFAIKAIYTDGILKHIQIKFYSFKENEYNEIDYKHAVIKSCEEISKFDFTKTGINHYIYFEQASLDKIDKAFEPLMWHLATVTHYQWQQFDIEDLFQICRLSMCKLYKAGYCIHPGILKKTFTNEVLLSMRKNRNNTDINFVSLETPLPTVKNESGLTLADTIEDTEYENRLEDKERQQSINEIFKIINKIIINEIGERRYNQLLIAHKNKCTNGSQRMLIIRIRKLLAKRGYDITWVRKMLRGDL